MKISQREARRLKKRVEELEQMESKRQSAWSADYPGGVNLVNIHVTPDVHAALKTARKLRHAVVATTNGENTVQFYALPLASQSNGSAGQP